MSEGTPIRVTPVHDDDLDSACHVVDLGDGGALLVDPPRDLRAVRAVLDAAGLSVRFVAETHLHTDFLSGAVQLAHDDDALVVAPGRRDHAHRPIVHGHRLDLGNGVTLTTWIAAGLGDRAALVLGRGDTPLGVFAERVPHAGSMWFERLRRATRLPADVTVWPTHVLPPRPEHRGDPAGAQLAMINRRGPVLLDGATAGGLAALPAATVALLRSEGVVLLDTRPIEEYSRAHIPGALAIPPGPGFSARLRRLANPDVPAVVVRSAGHDAADLVWRSLNVGFESIIGELEGGVEAWAAAGLSVISTPLLPAQRVGSDSRVLDVRATSEFATGHIPDAVHVELASVREAAPVLRPRPSVVMCDNGVRAASAVGLLERTGHFDVAILASSPAEWARATGRVLAFGQSPDLASYPARRRPWQRHR